MTKAPKEFMHDAIATATLANHDDTLLGCAVLMVRKDGTLAWPFGSLNTGSTLLLIAACRLLERDLLASVPPGTMPPPS